MSPNTWESETHGQAQLHIKSKASLGHTESFKKRVYGQPGSQESPSRKKGRGKQRREKRKKKPNPQ